MKAAARSPERDALVQRIGAAAGVEAWVEATLFRPRAGASPAAEAALRKVIAQVATGEPDYAALDPELVEPVKQQMPSVRRDMAGLGALRSLTFKEVDGLGSDVYHATFEHGEMDWVIYVTGDGHIATVFYPRPPTRTS